MPCQVDIPILDGSTTLRLVERTTSSSSSLPLMREVLSDYTNLVSKVFKIYMRQRLSQHINYLFLCMNILELHGSSLHHIPDVVVLYLYMI